MTPLNPAQMTSHPHDGVVHTKGARARFAARSGGTASIALHRAILRQLAKGDPVDPFGPIIRQTVRSLP